MKILITGHKGSIGSCLWKLLEGNELFGTEDIMNDELPDVDVVYHLGAKVDTDRSIIDPFWDMENIPMSLKIATKYRDKKIIYISSIAASEPFKWPYGISKRAGGDYIKFFCPKAVIIIAPTIWKGYVDNFARFLLKTKDFKPGTYRFRYDLVITCVILLKRIFLKIKRIIFGPPV